MRFRVKKVNKIGEFCSLKQPNGEADQRCGAATSAASVCQPGTSLSSQSLVILN